MDKIPDEMRPGEYLENVSEVGGLSQILVKTDEETDPKYGCIPEKRPIDEFIRKGIVNIDKPHGPSSNQVASWVKGILHVEKAGHSGTLDPGVTGVLPIAIEEATRITKILLSSKKEYVALMKIHEDVPKQRITEILRYFMGEIYQKPPLKSSVKRQLRKKNIYQIKILDIEDGFVLFSVSCEAGTYIRKLCHDIGLILGCGAHMQELRRVRVGSLDENNIVKLHDLKDAYEIYLECGNESYLRNCIIPMENSLGHLKKIWIKDTAVGAICHGAALNAPGVSKLQAGIEQGDVVSILSLKNELVAVGRSLRDSKEIHDMDKGKVVDLERVVMERGLYPDKWHSRGIN